MEELNILKGYKELYKDHKVLNDFYDKIIVNAKKVEVVSYKDIPELKDIVDKHLEFNRVVQKECYKNSCEPVINSLSKDLKYVEGLYTFHGLPIHHAWNVWKGEVYVDLTMEVNGRLEVGDSYISCVELDSETLRGHLLRSGMWGSFIAQHYTNGQEKYLPFGI